MSKSPTLGDFSNTRVLIRLEQFPAGSLQPQVTKIPHGRYLQATLKAFTQRSYNDARHLCYPPQRQRLIRMFMYVRLRAFYMARGYVMSSSGPALLIVGWQFSQHQQ